MKNKIILLPVTLLTLTGVVAAGLSTKNVLSGVKAEVKSFTYNETVGQEQFTNEVGAENVSVVTGVSSNLETEITFEKTSEGNQYLMSFGDGGYFVRNGGTVMTPEFIINIGANNITSATLTFGLIHDTLTDANEVQGSVYLYDDNNVYLDGSGTSTQLLNVDNTVTWSKKENQTFVATRLRVRCAAINGSVHWQEPIYIKSISLTWAC